MHAAPGPQRSQLLGPRAAVRRCPKLPRLLANGRKGGCGPAHFPVGPITNIGFGNSALRACTLAILDRFRLRAATRRRYKNSKHLTIHLRTYSPGTWFPPSKLKGFSLTNLIISFIDGSFDHRLEIPALEVTPVSTPPRSHGGLGEVTQEAPHRAMPSSLGVPTTAALLLALGVGEQCLRAAPASRPPVAGARPARERPSRRAGAGLGRPPHLGAARGDSARRAAAAGRRGGERAAAARRPGGAAGQGARCRERPASDPSCERGELPVPVARLTPLFSAPACGARGKQMEALKAGAAPTAAPRSPLPRRRPLPCLTRQPGRLKA